MHGWPQNHREFLPVIDGLTDRYTFIAPDLRGYADSEKPLDGYDPLTIAADMLALLDVVAVEKFHILGHDLGGPPSVALAYLASDRALSIATIETPFFGLDYPGYTDPQVAYWHLGMHMHIDITQFLVEGREDQYLRHFLRDFAYNPTAMPESEVQHAVANGIHAGVAIAVSSSVDAANLAFEIAGASAATAGDPIQRCWRDVNVASQHILFGRNKWRGAGAGVVGSARRPPSPLTRAKLIRRGWPGRRIEAAL
jgi:pimeloyl-ACP methyl ester carboxylesterase